MSRLVSSGTIDGEWGITQLYKDDRLLVTARSTTYVVDASGWGGEGWLAHDSADRAGGEVATDCSFAVNRSGFIGTPLPSQPPSAIQGDRGGWSLPTGMPA